MLRVAAFDQAQQSLVASMSLFGTALAAEGLTLFDPDLLPAVTQLTFFAWALAGWAAAQFDSLADLMQEGLEKKVRFGVVQKFFAAMAAGILAGYMTLHYLPNSSKIFAYAATFLFAYGGVALLTKIVDIIPEIVRTLLTKWTDSLPKGGKPPDQKP